MTLPGRDCMFGTTRAFSGLVEIFLDFWCTFLLQVDRRANERGMRIDAYFSPDIRYVELIQSKLPNDRSNGSKIPF